MTILVYIHYKNRIIGYIIVINMVLWHDLFLNGHYSQCFQELDNINDGSMLLEDVFILENNKCVCKGLMQLISGVNCNGSREAILQLYDNYSVSSSHRHLPIDLQMTFLFNCEWYFLTTLYKSPESIEEWDALMKRVAACCILVSGEASGLNEACGYDIVADLLQKILTAKKCLIQKRSTAIGIFMELISVSLLGILLTHKTHQVYTQVADFIKTILGNEIEFKSLTLLKQDSSSKISREVFKFGLNSGPSSLCRIDIESAFALTSLLGCFTSIRFKQVNSERYFSKGKTNWSSLWYYYQAFTKFHKEELNHALGFLLEGWSSFSSGELQCRYHCLIGQVYSAMGERHKALEKFSAAIKLRKNFPIAYYYQGKEFGKMGLHDKMLQSYQNMVMAMRNPPALCCAARSIETLTLELLHDPAEISKQGAIYVLAVAFGINEMFEDAAVAFEKILNLRNISLILDNGLIDVAFVVKLPNIVTILHEAASVNLLIGNLARAEEFCRQAITIYNSKEKTVGCNEQTDVHGTRDIEWIQNLLEEEFQMEIDKPQGLVSYNEENLAFFDEDVVGMLILAEIQRIQESEESRLTLNKILLLLSKYLALTQKEASNPDQLNQLALVQALTCKLCLHLARMQTSSKPFTEVDKMFKRALSCNNGDKDVLFHYASFLLAAGKEKDATKLWNTFFEKEPTVRIEHTQSLALRYLLRVQISQKLITDLSLKLFMKI